MKLKLKITTIISIFVALFINGCEIGNSANTDKNNVNTSTKLSVLSLQEEGVSNGIVDFFGEAFKDWGQSEFLKAIGMAPVTDTQFNQLETQMSDLSGQIQILINTDTQIYYSINNMQNYLENSSFNTLINEFNQLFDNNSIYYSGFVNATQISESPATFYSFNQIVSSTQILQNLSSALNCNPTVSGGVSCVGLTNAYEDTLNIIGQSSGSTTLNTFNVLNFAGQLFNAVQTKSLQGFPSAGNQNNYNLSNQMIMNNETIMAYLSQISLVLQQDYNMLSTMLYIKYNAESRAGFSGLTFPVSGMLDSESYAYNMQVLNQTYQDYFNTLHNIAAQYILSDNPNNPESAGAYTNVKTLAGVTGGNWSQSCNLYVWSGASTESNQGYNGTYNGGQLATQCFNNNQNIGNYALTMVEQCSDGHDPVSFYYGLNTNNNYTGQLQCTRAMNLPSTPSWNNNTWYGWFNVTTVHCSDFGCSNGNVGLNASGFNNYPLNNSWAAVSGIFGSNVGYATWGVDVATQVYGLNGNGLFQYISPTGLVDYFVVLVQGNPEGSSSTWSMQLQCANNDQWCSQMGSYNNQLNICVGHNQLQLQYQGGNGGGGNAVVNYVGGC